MSSSTANVALIPAAAVDDAPLQHTKLDLGLAILNSEDQFIQFQFLLRAQRLVCANQKLNRMLRITFQLSNLLTVSQYTPRA